MKNTNVQKMESGRIAPEHYLPHIASATQYTAQHSAQCALHCAALQPRADTRRAKPHQLASRQLCFRGNRSGNESSKPQATSRLLPNKPRQRARPALWHGSLACLPFKAFATRNIKAKSTLPASVAIDADVGVAKFT